VGVHIQQHGAVDVATTQGEIVNAERSNRLVTDLASITIWPSASWIRSTVTSARCGNQTPNAK
jgi:hypothetical protein